MKRLIKKSCLALAVSLGSVIASAEPVTVYGFELKNRMSVEGTEHYDHFWQEMQKRGLDIDLKITSLSRYLSSFANDTDSCIFPTGTRSLLRAIPELTEDMLIEASIVDHSGIAILTKADHKKIENMEQLNGLNLSHWVGLKTEQFLPDVEYASLEKVLNDEVQMKMLDRGRVDAVVGFIPDMFVAAEKFKLDMPKVQFWIVPRIPTKGATVVCHKNERNQKIIEKFNEELAALKSSGELRKMMGPMVDIGDSQPLPYD